MAETTNFAAKIENGSSQATKGPWAPFERMRREINRMMDLFREPAARCGTDAFFDIDAGGVRFYLDQV